MFLSNELTQVLIILGLVIVFVITYLLNKRTKAPKGVKVPEKCLSCTSNHCIVKISKVEELKKELEEEIAKCEDKDEEK